LVQIIAGKENNHYQNCTSHINAAVFNGAICLVWWEAIGWKAISGWFSSLLFLEEDLASH
jgi:hypothetical protein